MNKTVFSSVVITVFILSMLVVAVPAYACKAVDCDPSDRVDMGVSSSEAGHNLQSWGPPILGVRNAWAPLFGDTDKSGYLDYGVPGYDHVTTKEVSSNINIFKIVINGVEQPGQGMGAPLQIVPKGQYTDTFGRTVTFTERTITITGLVVHHEWRLASASTLSLRALNVPFKVYVNGVLVLTNTNTNYAFNTFSVGLPPSLAGATVLNVKVEATGKLIPALVFSVDWIQIDYTED